MESENQQVYVPNRVHKCCAMQEPLQPIISPGVFWVWVYYLVVLPTEWCFRICPHLQFIPFAGRSYPQSYVFKTRTVFGSNTEKTVTKREIKEVFEHLVFDTCVLFTFFIWTIHRSWFLFENMAKNLGLIEATLKKKLSRRSSPKLRFPLLHSLWTAFFFKIEPTLALTWMSQEVGKWFVNGL